MDSEDFIGDLGDAQIQHNAGERKCVFTGDAAVLDHQIEHGIEGNARRDVKAFIKAKGQPAGIGPGARRCNVHARVQMERQLHIIDWAFEGSMTDFAIALRGVPVTRGK